MKDIIKCDDSIFKAPVTSILFTMSSVIDSNYNKKLLECKKPHYTHLLDVYS